MRCNGLYAFLMRYKNSNALVDYLIIHSFQDKQLKDSFVELTERFPENST